MDVMPYDAQHPKRDALVRAGLMAPAPVEVDQPGDDSSRGRRGRRAE